MSIKFARNLSYLCALVILIDWAGMTIMRPVAVPKIDASTYETVASQIASGASCRARAVAQRLATSPEAWTSAVNEILKANQKQVELDSRVPVLQLSDRTIHLGGSEQPLHGIGVSGKVGGRQEAVLEAVFFLDGKPFNVGCISTLLN